MNPGDIEHYVKRWFVLSQLRGRYSGSSESIFDYDIKKISELGIVEYLNTTESSDLSDGFWDVGLVSELDKAIISSPFLSVFFASQVHGNDPGFLSTDITVRDMIIHRGDIHHLFPKKYLQQKYQNRSDYNQIANFVYAQQEINIKIADKAPKEYFEQLKEQIETGNLKYGDITDNSKFEENLSRHCIPKEIMGMELEDYPKFLELRRVLMAKKIKEYYFSL